VSGLSVIASVILGTLLYRSFKHVQFHKSSSSQKHFRHLLALLLLTTVSFILKIVWNLVIGSVARRRWRNYEISTSQFGTLWFFYYFITELLPLTLALVQQYRSEFEQYHSDSSSSHNSGDRKKSSSSSQQGTSKNSSSSYSTYQPSDNTQNNSNNSNNSGNNNQVPGHVRTITAEMGVELNLQDASASSV